MYVHHVPGRLRLKAEAFRQHQAALDAACRRLECFPGAESVTPNRFTGSIVLRYDPTASSPATLQRALRRCGLPASMPAAGLIAGNPVAEHIADAAVRALLQYLMRRLTGAMFGEAV